MSADDHAPSPHSPAFVNIASNRVSLGPSTNPPKSVAADKKPRRPRSQKWQPEETVRFLTARLDLDHLFRSGKNVRDSWARVGAELKSKVPRAISQMTQH